MVSPNRKLIKEFKPHQGLASLLPPPEERIRTPVFILALDGGGIRSLLPIYALKFIEKKLSLPISSIFDVIAATSTSSLIAAGLAIPNEEGDHSPMYTTEDLSQVIESSLAEVFSTKRPVDPYVTRPRYEDKQLEDFLEVFYPGNFGSALTNLVFPTYDRVMQEMFRFCSWKDSQKELRYNQVLRATTASPNYFTAHEMTVEEEEKQLVEGGLFEYNPTGLGADEAMKLFTWQPQVVLSLGSGNVQEHRKPYVVRTPSCPVWGSPFQDAKIRCAGERHHRNMELAFGGNYTRVQIDLNLDEETLLNEYYEDTDYRPSTSQVFMEVGKRYLEENKKHLRAFCEAFKGNTDIKDNTWSDISKLDFRCEKPPTDENQEIWELVFNSSPLDYIDPTDREELSKVKKMLLLCLDMLDDTKKEKGFFDKQHFFLFKSNPLYKEMKHYMKLFEERGGMPDH